MYAVLHVFANIFMIIFANIITLIKLLKLFVNIIIILRVQLNMPKMHYPI